MLEFQISDSILTNRYSYPFVTKPVNEHAPVFGNLPNSVDVKENTPIEGSASVFTVRATDADSEDTGDGQVYYELDSSNGYFDIDRKSGEVFQIAELDYEAPLTSVTVSVVAKDETGGLGAYPTADLTVNIVNVNDQAPTWDPASVWDYTQAENTNTGVTLATLSATPGDDLAADLRYSITKQSPPSPAYFEILDATTGVITTTTNALDYETANDVILYVKVCDSKGAPNCLSATGLVYVSVTDVNEYSPQFVKTAYAFEVREDAQVGYKVGTVDIQTGANQESVNNPNDAKCSFTASSTYFSIDPNTCIITLIASIDRETTASESVTVKATDTSDSTKTSTVPVTISVSDVNDVTPTCTGAPTYAQYNVNEEQNGVLIEDSGGTAICIICTDTDATSRYNRASVSYEITSINGQEGDDSFARDDTQGGCQFGIKTNKALSYEDGIHEFLIEVTITDNNKRTPDALSSVVYIPVQLNDVNEDDPTFVKPSTPASFTITISEAMPRGAVFYTVEGKQAEDTLTEIRYSISTNPQIKGYDSANVATNQPDSFIISELTGELMVNTDLDYSVYRRYEMEMTLIDTQGTFGSIPTATVTISIQDINNNAPQFINGAHHTFSVAEGTAADTEIGTIEATDLDAPPNSNLSFYVQSGNTGNMFKLVATADADQRSVALALSSSDCETTPKYDLVVIAVDGAVSGTQLTTTTTVHVEVTGVNEFPPQWAAGSSTSLTVAENTAVGTVVGTISATDQDTCSNHGDIVYQIVDEKSSPVGHNGLFALDRFSGEIKIVKEIDRETVSSVKLQVQACDEEGSGSGTEMCTSSTLTIAITDVNDNNPICTSSGLGFTLREDSPEQTTLTTLNLICSDADATSSFNTLTYTLSPTISPFAIDSSTGQLYLSSASTLNFEATTSYSSTVFVSDGVSNTFNISISIQVTNVNEFAPTAQVGGPLTPVSPISIAENTPTGSSIVQLNFKDDDSGVDGELLCTLYNGTELFRIDPYTCEVFLISELDYETSPTCYTILAIVYDRATNSDDVKSTEQLFEVCKTDFNDNQPICDPTLYIVYIDDDIQANEVIQTVVCSDDDSTTDDNNVLYYEVTNQTPTPAWGNFLARTSGTSNPGPDIEVSAIVDLESHATDFFELAITVKDQNNAGSNILTVNSNLTVFVYVRDINNNDPSITSPASPSSVNFQERECCSGITLVQTITISDSDFTHATSNVPFTGQIISGNSGNTFRLLSNANWNQIELHIAKSVDRETTSTYELVIEVFDEPDYKGTQKTATLSLTVDITDANDNNLLCNPSEVTVLIAESFTGATGTYLPCSDVDTTGTMVASLTSGTPADFATYFSFITGPSTHTLQLNVLSGLDFNVNGNHSYQLVVGVTDGTHRSQEVTVHVQITDVDGGNGVLTCSNVNIGEESSVGALVLDASTYFDATADPEWPYDSYTFSFSAGNSGGYFVIEPLTGLIRTAQSLDREVASSVSVTLAVNDGSTDVTCTFDIEIDEYNDNAPCFNPQTYAVSLNEYVAIGTTVATLTIDDGDDSTLPAGQVILSDLTMKAISGNETWFSLTNCAVPVTNQFCLVTAKSIDYDQFKFHRLKIESSDNSMSGSNGPILTGFAVVLVDIAPVNSNPPQIIETSTGSTNSFSFPEDQAVGSQLVGITLTASDADSADTWFGRVRYLLDFSFDSDPTAAAETFMIDQYTGAVYLIHPLDYQTKTLYTLYMNVTDNYTGGFTDSYQFTVGVTDVNDESPQFTSQTYFGNIDDAAVNPTTVTITSPPISATDNDVNTLYNAITYSIDTARCSGGSQCSDFTIHPTTAVLTVTTSIIIDYESGKTTYIIPIKASDPDGNEDTAIVYITVNDINDNAPVLFPNPSYVSIYEQLPINTVIAQLTADDADSIGLNVGFTFTQLNFLTLFSTGSSTGLITVTSTLDRESASSTFSSSQYALEIEVADQGTNPGALTATATIFIDVMDINDNDPVFSQSTYTASVSECLDPYETITTISATDADFEVNSELSYTFGQSVTFFHLDEPTGIVTSLVTLDRETYTTGFTYKVVARDHGVVSRSGTATVQIEIVDCNDETPIFGQTLYTWEVSEDASINTLITDTTSRLTASDRDEPGTLNSQIKFNVTGSAIGVFEMFTEDDGNIRTSAFLDRETQAAYSFDCIAYDQGTPQLTGTASCIVYILDVNDNRPTYAQSSYTITVNENLPIGDVIATLIATDNDEMGNVNSEIQYTITDSNSDTDYGNATFYFNYGLSTGSLTVRREIDYELTTQVIFELTATDKGTTALSGTTTVTMSILDLNDNAPVFQPSNFYHAIVTPQFSDVFSCAEIVTATDIDSGQNAQIVYSFGSREIKFEIGPDSGCVQLRLDQTIRPDERYAMRVVATDNGNPSLSAQGVVRVDVLNIELSGVQFILRISYAQFDEITQEMFNQGVQAECQRTYPNCVTGIIFFLRNESKRRRRRTASINSGQTITVYVYAYSSDLDLSNTEADANFLTADEMLAIFQQAGDGTPVPGLLDPDVFGDFPIVSVSAYPKEEKAFLDNVTNRWILAISILTGILILAVIALYVYFHLRSNNTTGTRVTLVKPTYKSRGGGGGGDTTRGRGGGDGGRAPNYRRETSRGEEMRRKVKDSNQAKRQSTAAAAPQPKPDTSRLQQKSVAPVVAAVPTIPKQQQQPQQPVGKPSVVEGAKTNENKDKLHAEDDKPDVGKQEQQQPVVANVNQVLVKEKGAGDQGDRGGGTPPSDLDEFNGMALDPATGKYYAYNNKTGKRRWLRTNEVDIMKAKLNK